MENLITRKLEKNEEIPYDLLLLADETIEAINKYISDSDIYIIEEADKPVAVYALYQISTEVVEIKNIAVDTPYQGQGIGSFLLSDAEKRAEGYGYSEIIIGTADTAIVQLHLYQKMGFEKFEVKKDFFIINYMNAIFENDVQLKDMIMLRKKLQKRTY